MTGLAIALGIAVVLLVAVSAGVTRIYLRGQDLSAFDHPTGQVFATSHPSGEGEQAVLASLRRVRDVLRSTPRRDHTRALRACLDAMFADADPTARYLPVDDGGVRGEWVLAPGADPALRTLYVHGGAFNAGSPRSHRRLTSAFSRITGGAVFAVDYRLLPEHRRIDGVDDCRAAYRWLLDNGPDGRAPAERIWVAGDSAGGNLALSLLAWVRDAGLRPPDGAVALSPLTDCTLASPSLRTHVATDPMLGPLFGPLARAPRALLLWLGWWQNRMRPCDPRISPVYGDLSRLPPVLVQASEVEMLRDDARRYVNRAIAAGSPVRLQTWANQVHVWQIFHPELRAGREALEEVRRFIATTQPMQAAATIGRIDPESGWIRESHSTGAPPG